MIFHFDFANCFRMLRLAWHERNPRARAHYLGALFVWLPVVSAFHAICFFLDVILFPGLSKTEIRTPLFVVGHARSGTTLVHRLISKDEGRFSAFVLYELYFPSLPQKNLVRFFAGIDLRYLGGLVERRVHA